MRRACWACRAGLSRLRSPGSARREAAGKAKGKRKRTRTERRLEAATFSTTGRSDRLGGALGTFE